MNRILLVVVPALLLLLLTVAFTQDKPPPAAGDPAAPPGLVAVVDLDRAVKDVGLDFQYQSNLAAARQDLEAQLRVTRTRLAGEVAALQTQLAAAKDDHAKADLQRAIAEKTRQDQAAINDTQARLVRFDQKMKQEFRASLQPTLRKISEAHGGRVLLVRDLGVAYVPTALDLTDELIAELQAHPIKLPTTRPD